jgi:hypothetical protein
VERAAVLPHKTKSALWYAGTPATRSPPRTARHRKVYRTTNPGRGNDLIRFGEGDSILPPATLISSVLRPPNAYSCNARSGAANVGGGKHATRVDPCGRV